MYIPPLHPHVAPTYSISPHVFILHRRFPPFPPGMQDIKTFFGNCFIQTEINLFPDDGPSNARNM